jgi:ketosteroid isomerase-like protein
MPADSPRACMTDFTAALVRRDIGAALALLTDDVVFFYSNGTAIRGKDAFAAVMTASWSVVETYEYSTLESAWIDQSEAAAAVIYSFAWSGVARGQDVSGGGRGTRVFRKAPGAGWLISHEHLSTGQWTP